MLKFDKDNSRITNQFHGEVSEFTINKYLEFLKPVNDKLEELLGTRDLTLRMHNPHNNYYTQFRLYNVLIRDTELGNVLSFALNTFPENCGICILSEVNVAWGSDILNKGMATLVLQCVKRLVKELDFSVLMCTDKYGDGTDYTACPYTSKIIEKEKNVNITKFFNPRTNHNCFIATINL